MGCQFCERQIPDNLGVCPHCGRPQDMSGANGQIILRFALVAFLSVVILAAWHWMTG